MNGSKPGACAPKDEITVRAAEERDVPACLRIYNYYILNTAVSFEEQPLTAEAFADRLRRISASYPYLVAERAGRVVGYAYLDRYGERSAYRFTADLSVYVDRDCLASGVGAALLERIEALGRAQGLRSIISVITGSNARILAFHQKHGFRQAGRIMDAGYKFGGWLDVEFWQKLLLPGNGGEDRPDREEVF